MRKKAYRQFYLQKCNLVSTKRLERPQTEVFDNFDPHIYKLAICFAHVFFASHEVLGVDIRSVSSFLSVQVLLYLLRQYFLISDISHQNRKKYAETPGPLSLMAHKVYPKLRSGESRECPACLVIGIFGLWAGMRRGKNVYANNLQMSDFEIVDFVCYLLII